MVESKRKDEGDYAKFLEQVIDTLPVPIYVKDAETRFVFSNRHHDELVGRHEDEMIGKSDADFYPPEAVKNFLALDLNVIKTGEVSIVEEMNHSTGGIARAVSSHKARMISPDGSVYLVGTNFDLTEMKKREEQYRALAETVPVGVMQFEDDGTVSFANPLLTFTFDVGEGNSFLKKMLHAMGNPEDFPSKVSRHECAMVDRNGEVRRVLVNSSGWLNHANSGKRNAIVSVVDISENAELKRINDEVSRLNQELAARMQQLSDAQEALVKKGRMEQMGQLTATIAHELRNPMGAIRTAAFVLGRKLQDKGLGVEQQVLRINNGIARCDAIITQLLDFSRTKKVVAQAGDLDAWLVHMVEEDAKRLAGCITISCVLGLNGRLVPFDQTRLQRAIINLISNAAEAMVGNGDKPLVDTGVDPRIDVATAIDGEFVSISVTDNGPGMSAEVLAKTRDPLFTTKSFGTGLGVPAIEQIAVQHGGELQITSKPGEGACFVLRLPLVQQLTEEAA